MEATDLLVNDYVTGANALGGGGPPPQPCVVSFKVVWSGVNEVSPQKSGAESPCPRALINYSGNKFKC